MRNFPNGLQSSVMFAAIISGKALRSKGMWCSVAAVMVALLLSSTVVSAQVYRPSSYQDGTLSPTINPAYAYDASLTTYADVYGYADFNGNYIGSIHYTGFPSVVLSSTKTLTVTARFEIGGAGPFLKGVIQYSFDGMTFTTLYFATTSQGEANHTISVPSGTNLGNVQVYVKAQPGPQDGNSVNVLVYDIKIQ